MKIEKDTWVLMTKAGTHVTLNSTHADFRGEKAVITGGTPPHKQGSSGYVDTKGGRFYPSVYGMTWENQAEGKAT